jgi:hypothetical protein
MRIPMMLAVWVQGVRGVMMVSPYLHVGSFWWF